jgi:hypothetical protein
MDDMSQSTFPVASTQTRHNHVGVTKMEDITEALSLHKTSKDTRHYHVGVNNMIQKRFPLAGTQTRHNLVRVKYMTQSTFPRTITQT